MCRYSVGKVTPQQSRRLTHGDFSPKSTIKVRFPREGSQMTPPHPSDDFKWKDYCPMVFRYHKPKDACIHCCEIFHGRVCYVHLISHGRNKDKNKPRCGFLSKFNQ